MIGRSTYVGMITVGREEQPGKALSGIFTREVGRDTLFRALLSRRKSYKRRRREVNNLYWHLNYQNPTQPNPTWNILLYLSQLTNTLHGRITRRLHPTRIPTINMHILTLTDKQQVGILTIKRIRSDRGDSPERNRWTSIRSDTKELLIFNY